MPLFDPKDNFSRMPVNDETTPNIHPKKYDGIEVETKYDDQRKLLTFVSGRTWYVDYFRQLLGNDDEASGHSVDTPGAFQQYERIKNFELKVTSALSQEWDAANTEWKANGSAYIYPVIKPNVKDTFIADIGDGKLGEFNIDSVKELSYYKDTVYEVDYTLIRECHPDYLNDLIAKTVVTKRLDKDQLLHGNVGLLSEDTAIQNDTLKGWRSTIFRELFHFVDDEEFTWRLPTVERIYDHGYARMMFRLFDQRDYPTMNAIRTLNADVRKEQQYITLWDALLEKDRRYLYQAERAFHVCPKRVFAAPAILGSAFYTSFAYFIFSQAYLTTHLSSIGLTMTPESRRRDMAHYSDLPEVHICERYQKLIKPVLCDNAYVLSDAFYTGEGELSVLEDMVKQYLDGQGTDRDRLQQLLEECMHWGALEKFYYLPILVILIDEAIYGR